MKLQKSLIFLFAAVLLVAMCFAGVASADTSMVAPEEFTSPITVNASEGGWAIKTDFPVDSGYYIKNESNWRYVVNDVNTDWGGSPYKNANLVLTQDIVFSEPVDSLGSNRGFVGIIYGNGYKFINFTQTPEMGGRAHGLIHKGGDYYDKKGCELNYVQMTDSNINSSVDHVGSLIGEIDWDTKLLKCSVTMSNVTSSSYLGSVGGMVGYDRANRDDDVQHLWINASIVDSVYIASSNSGVGGMIGYFYCRGKLHNGYVIDCMINGSEIRGGSSCGGVCGFYELVTDCGHIQNTTVKDCKIWADSDYAGGLLGYLPSDRACNITGCTVENCTVEIGGEDVGGVVGRRGGTITYNPPITWVNRTWINGTKLNGSLIGYNFDYFVQNDNAQHSNVAGPTGASPSTDPKDNNFDFIFADRETTFTNGYGSIIDKNHLEAGKDYGYRGYYVVSPTSSEMGSVTVTPQGGLTGTQITVSATPAEGYLFKEWTASPEVTFADSKKATTTFNLQASSVAVTAHFAAPPAAYVEVSNWKELNQSVSEWNATGTEKGRTRTVVVMGDISDREEGENKAGIDVKGNVVIKPVASSQSNEFKVNGNGYGRLFNIAKTGNLTLAGNGTKVLNLTGGNWTTNDKAYGGAILVTGGNLTLNGGAKITYSNVKRPSKDSDCSGGAVALTKGARFTMNGDASIAYCTSNNDGGAVNLGENNTDPGNQFTMNDYSTITNCIAIGFQGGAIYCRCNNVVIMNDHSSITDCIAKGERVTDGPMGGGGVRMYGSIFMNDYSSISNCTVTNSGKNSAYGGGILLGHKSMVGKLEMTGNSTITGCKANDYGGGVYVHSGSGKISTFNVSGNATIVNNTLTAGTTNNVHLVDSNNLKLTGPFTGRIGIVYPSTGKFGSTETGASGAENFVLDNSNPLQVGKINISGNNNLYWTLGHMVVFEPNNGEESWDKPVEDNTKVAEPEDPVRKGYTFTGWYNGGTKWDFTTNVTEDLTLTAKWQDNSQPYTPSPHHESGQTVIQQQVPVQDVSADPTPANQATADISVKYVSQSVIGTSTSDIAAIKQLSAEAAAQMEIMLSTAQAAGIPLTNSKGAKAVVVTDQNIPGVEKVTFSRVYEISPANEGEKLTKVTVKVPKSDITSKGLTSDDVTVYHFLESYNLWQPLETLSVSQDADNYYYTAATDGTSPFGVLVKKIGDTATPTTTQTQKSPVPLAGLVLGLGAAAVLLRFRR